MSIFPGSDCNHASKTGAAEIGVLPAHLPDIVDP
jgi:hypothetical protein